jgi:hypothetical protein
MDMNFREFFRLHENRFYYAYLDRQGKYNVSSHFFPTPQARDSEAKEVQAEEKPQKMWFFTIRPGDSAMNIPGASDVLAPGDKETEREKIGRAYYSRFGFDRPYEGEPMPHDDGSDTIEPGVFSKWKPFNPAATTDYSPPPRRV